MESLISSSSSAVIECGLRNIRHTSRIGKTNFFLFGLPDGRVFSTVISSDSVSVLQDFDACPDVTGSPLHKMRFIERFDLLITHSDSQVWMHLRDAGSNTFFPGGLVADDVNDFDVQVNGGDGLLVFLKPQRLVQVVKFNRTHQYFAGEFRLEKIGPAAVQWATPTLLSVVERNGGILLVSVDGTIEHVLEQDDDPHPADHGSTERELPAVVPLGNSFEFNDRSGKSEYKNTFAVVSRDHSGRYFPYRASIFQHTEGKLVSTHEFPLLHTAPPSFVTWCGPWLVVGGKGLDFYEYESGSYAQCTLEEDDVITCDLASQCLCADSPCADWFAKQRLTACTTAAGLKVLSLLPPAEIIVKLFDNAAFQMDRIELLMQYGHSVGVSRLLPREFRASSMTVSAKSVIFSSYGGLLSRFVFSEASVEGSQHPSPSRSRSCCVCSRSISSKAKCFACHKEACSSCLVKVSLTDLGLSDKRGTTSRVCKSCDGACDNNLYVLLTARRYHQSILYAKEFQNRCHKFPIEEIMELSIEQCFHEEKYEWCAKLLCRYVGSVSLWDQWIMSFSLAGKLSILADVFPTARVESAGTSMLLQLIKCDPLRLYQVVKKWKQRSYDKDVVKIGIETRLRSRQRDAMLAYRSIGGDEATAVGGCTGWYLDRDTEHLVLSLLRLTLTDTSGTALVACNLYLEHYLLWSPAGEFYPQTRRRSASVFETRPRKEFPPHRIHDLIDFWELFTSHQLLEEFLAIKPKSLHGGPLLIPLLRHFTHEMCRYLFSFEGSKSNDLIDEIVEQLQGVPLELLSFLDALTAFSPTSTSRYHPALAQLYLHHCPSKLLPFVRNRQVENLDWLTLACQAEQRRMFPELVYIIGRTGNDKEAVRIALRCLRDVTLAIQYVQDSEDTSLWDEMIAHVIESQELVGQFLEVVGDRFDPSVFLRRVPAENRLCIPQLGQRLGRLIIDRKSSLGIAEAHLHSLSNDVVTATRRLRRSMGAATRINPCQPCALCRLVITANVVVVSSNGRAFHKRCFEKTFVRKAAEGSALDQVKAAVRQEDLLNQGMYEARRRCGVTDPMELLPMNVVKIITSLLGPYGRVASEQVSSRWRKIFMSMRKFTFSDTDYLFAKYVQKRTNSTCPTMTNTFHSSLASRCKEYVLREDEID